MDREEQLTRQRAVRAGLIVITIRGTAGPAVLAAFDDLEVVVEDDTTILRSPECGQAALHGLLDRIRDLGPEVLEVPRAASESRLVHDLTTTQTASLDWRAWRFTGSLTGIDLLAPSMKVTLGGGAS